MMKSLVATLLITFCSPAATAPATIPLESVAFYYGAIVPVDLLQQFDAAVVDPDSGFVPSAFGYAGRNVDTKATQWIAYVAAGEVRRSRDYFPAIPQDWLIGANPDWGSEIINVAEPEWPAFFVKHVAAPLWKRGYRGFFLDTLDSYERVASDDRARADSRRGLAAVIRAVKRAYPEASVITNRGFEILPEVRGLVTAVAFESLFRGWSQAQNEYTVVPLSDRQWLLDQVDRVKTEFGLPVIAIDYCVPDDDTCIRQTVQRIRSLGIVPYVTDGHLQTVNTMSVK